jgi:hypothetical protein
MLALYPSHVCSNALLGGDLSWLSPDFVIPFKHVLETFVFFHYSRALQGFAV